MKKNKFDLIVIGAGSGGLGAALGALTLGLQVLMIDKSRERIGGECLNTGCIPSKALLHVSKLAHSAKIAERFGSNIQGTYDINKIKYYISQKQDSIRAHENVDYLRKKGLAIEIGTASFSGKQTVKVNDRHFQARNIIIATGSKPASIRIEGAEITPTFTNETIFDIEFIPNNFIFIGAGPVSIELGQAFSRLGSKVSIIDHGDRILKKEDPEISEILMNILLEEDIDFYFNSEVKKVMEHRTVVINNKTGKVTEIPVDAIFFGIGRKLDFESLNLGAAGIKIKDGKIVLNEKLQTTNKNVFVSGDAANNFNFSHAAEMHNMLILNNLLSPFKKKLDTDHFPWVTFCNPEVATFGLNEERLSKSNIKYEKLETSLKEADRAVTDNFEYGKLILFIQKKKWYVNNAKILGGSMIAPGAGEIVQELILANISGLKIKHFMNKIYPYPTAGNIIKITLRNRALKALKPWIKKLLLHWYRFKE